MVIKVIAYMDIDPEEVIKEVSSEYNESIEEVTMDDIFEYVNNNVKDISYKGRGDKWMTKDGPALCGFSDDSWYEIQEVLERMKKN